MALAAIDSLRGLGGTTMVDGMEMKYGINEVGEIAHQHLSGKDGINVTADHNYDVAGESAAHFTKDMSTGTQKVIGGTVNVAKHVAELTPGGRLAGRISKTTEAIKSRSTATAGTKNGY